MVLLGITRKQAFLAHLTFSAAIFCVLSYLIVCQWYPEFYFMLDGGLRAIATIFFVDIILGPGLTLLLFKPGKKGLWFDLTIILIFQASALIWGIQSVYTERSGSAVYYWGQLSCIPFSETSRIDMASVYSRSKGQQRLSLLPAPGTFDERYDFIKKAFESGTAEIFFYSDKIVPLDELVVDIVDRYKFSIDKLREVDASSADIVEAYIKPLANNKNY